MSVTAIAVNRNTHPGTGPDADEQRCEEVDAQVDPQQRRRPRRTRMYWKPARISAPKHYTIGSAS